jgi:hypothetical protein
MVRLTLPFHNEQDLEISNLQKENITQRKHKILG